MLSGGHALSAGDLDRGLRARFGVLRRSTTAWVALKLTPQSFRDHPRTPAGLGQGNLAPETSAEVDDEAHRRSESRAPRRKLVGGAVLLVCEPCLDAPP